MEEGNIDLAWEIMDQLSKMNNNEIIINKLRTNYPLQFSKALKYIEMQ